MTKTTVKELRATAKALKIKGYSSMNKAGLEAAIAAAQNISAAAQTTKSDAELQAEFTAAFSSIDDGLGMARVYDLRRKLGWTREDFDRTIETLRDQMTIHLDIVQEYRLTKDQLEDCYFDKNGQGWGFIVWSDDSYKREDWMARATAIAEENARNSQAAEEVKEAETPAKSAKNTAKKSSRKAQPTKLVDFTKLNRKSYDEAVADLSLYRVCDLRMTLKVLGFTSYVEGAFSRARKAQLIKAAFYAGVDSHNFTPATM